MALPQVADGGTASYMEGKKAIPVQASTGPEGSRKLRLPRCMTIGTRSWSDCQSDVTAAFTAKKYCWHSFLLVAESTPGATVRLEGLNPMKNSNHTIVN